MTTALGDGQVVFQALAPRLQSLVVGVARDDERLGDDRLFVLDQFDEKILQPVREVQKPLKDVSKVCHAIIEAREKGEDMAKALDRVIQWPAFTTSVQAVDTLIAPDVIDGKIEMLQRYPTIRKLAPQFLSTLVFRGHAVAANLLRALSVVAGLYRTGKRTIPDKAPISFAPKALM